MKFGGFKNMKMSSKISLILLVLVGAHRHLGSDHRSA